MSGESAKRVAVIAGDGIGAEVIGSAREVLTRALGLNGIRVVWDEFPWGSDFYRETGQMMPQEGLRILEGYDAIFLGAVGDPAIPDDVTLWGVTLAIRQGFDQYINYRPVRWLRGIPPRLAGKDPSDVDMVFIRENTEGEYVDVGGRALTGRRELALQGAVFTREGVERVVRYALEEARRLGRSLTSVTKSNALRHSMVFWDEVLEEVAEDFPDVERFSMLVDAAAYRMVVKPEDFGVVVASNLFGDVLTDLAAALQGSLGVAASANLNPSGQFPSAFEPVHGSAPDIAGKGIANPIGAIWAGTLMLHHLGFPEAAKEVLGAVEDVCQAGLLTPDIGGSTTTEEFASSVMARMERRRPASG